MKLYLAFWEWEEGSYTSHKTISAHTTRKAALKALIAERQALIDEETQKFIANKIKKHPELLEEQFNLKKIKRYIRKDIKDYGLNGGECVWDIEETNLIDHEKVCL